MKEAVMPQCVWNNFKNMWEFFIVSLTTLFVIVDPIAAVPAFIAMTPSDPPTKRIKMAGIASIVTWAVLTFFAIAGDLIFRIFGLTIQAFQLAGSVILLMVALDMLRAIPSRVRLTEEETFAGAEKEDIAITPLGIPLLAGPGAITTVLLFRSQVDSFIKEALLLLSITLVSIGTYGILRASAYGGKWLSPIATRLITRLMGLLLAAVAMQFAINALSGVQAVSNRFH